MSIIFTVIGDLVRSRRAASRSGLQRELAAALREVAPAARALDRFEPTVGDEFQGVFGSLADAVSATLRIRLRLDGVVDVRCGIGSGTREVFDTQRHPMLQDGPAWWSAREAIETLGRPGRRDRRTWYVATDAVQGPPAAAVNAFLTTRDALLDRQNARARRILRLALDGQSQRAIADREGVSESAVSQAFARGVRALRDSDAMFATLSDAVAGRPAATAGR